MKTISIPKPRSAAKRSAAPARTKKVKKFDISWLVDRQLRPAEQLIENPVLLVREGRL